MKKIITITLFVINVFLFFPTSTLAQDTVDLECLKRKLFDSSVVCDPLPENVSVTVVDPSVCESTPGYRSCNPEERCFRYYDSLQGIDDIGCVKVINATGCGSACGEDEQCVLVNALSGGIGPVTGMVPELSTHNAEYNCVSNTEPGSLNIFGANVGPINQFVPKLLRTGLSVLLGFFGFYALWNIFWAIWDSTTGRSQEKYENAQKTVLNAFMGLFYVIIGLLAVQLLSNLFGISGNIFEFRYEAPGVYPVTVTPTP